MDTKPRYRWNADGSFTHLEGAAPRLGVDQLQPAAFGGGFAASETSIFDGDKFPGGFGVTQLQFVDYWTLRKRSSQLFNENLYARGMIRRLVTNEINTGLTPEAAPDENIVGLSEDFLADWSEDTETRFDLWAQTPALCDWFKQSTFGAIQRAARREALIEGDVLVFLRFSQVTGLPAIQLIPGGNVQTPLDPDSLRRGHVIKHGVEFDTRKRQVAYWIVQDDGTMKRLPAFGERSGRRLAWLVYGTDHRLDEVRGQPMLALVLQSLKEIDRYRDNIQRRAVVNSILAMFIEKTADKPGTLPMSNSAVRKDSVNVDDGSGGARSLNITKHIPGVVLEELQTGEKPHAFQPQADGMDFGRFEEAIIQAVAWANEIPPEILRLAFSNNYSASQAAINEFKIYLNLVWAQWGQEMCTPIYQEWLLRETLSQKIKAPGLLEARANPRGYDTLAAWFTVEWYGSIKPSTDVKKQAQGSQILVQEGWSTNAREARVTTGTKFSRNMKRLKRENEQKMEAQRPIAEFNQEFGITETDTETTTNALHNVIDDYLQERESGAG